MEVMKTFTVEGLGSLINMVRRRSEEIKKVCLEKQLAIVSATWIQWHDVHRGMELVEIKTVFFFLAYRWAESGFAILVNGFANQEKKC